MSGKPFRHVQKGNVYTDSEWEMWQCLSGIAGLALLVYMTAEALYVEAIAERLCWTKTNEGRLEERRSVVEWRAILFGSTSRTCLRLSCKVSRPPPKRLHRTAADASASRRR
jgi:hypothetical protein